MISMSHYGTKRRISVVSLAQLPGRGCGLTGWPGGFSDAYEAARPLPH